jgi:hypothetical protein
MAKCVAYQVEACQSSQQVSSGRVGRQVRASLFKTILDGHRKAFTRPIRAGRVMYFANQTCVRRPGHSFPAR